jgi:cell division transport system permease protein
MHKLLTYFQRPDIPFSREDATRTLPWVVAVMVCLASLLLSAGISLHQTSARSGGMNLQVFQVYLPHGKTALMSEVMTDLRAREDVAQVVALTPQKMQELVAPWTSGELAMDDLPLPQVLEVKLQPTAPRAESISAIATALKARDETIDIESYQDWVDQLSVFTGTLRSGVFMLVALLVGALMALVFVVVRTSLMLHFHAVRLLHHLGARDDYIIRQFVANGCLMVLKGSAMGMGLASLLAVAISMVSLQQASPLLPELALGGWHVFALIALPLLMVGGTALLVRVTMKQLLGQMN